MKKVMGEKGWRDMQAVQSQREASEQSNKEGGRANQAAVESYVEEQERCSEDFFKMK